MKVIRKILILVTKDNIEAIRANCWYEIEIGDIVEANWIE